MATEIVSSDQKKARVAFYRQYKPFVLDLCLKLTGNDKELANQVLVRVFTNAFKTYNSATFREDCNIRLCADTNLAFAQVQSGMTQDSAPTLAQFEVEMALADAEGAYAVKHASEAAEPAKVVRSESQRVMSAIPAVKSTAHGVELSQTEEDAFWALDEDEAADGASHAADPDGPPASNNKYADGALHTVPSARRSADTAVHVAAKPKEPSIAAVKTVPATGQTASPQRAMPAYQAAPQTVVRPAYAPMSYTPMVTTAPVYQAPVFQQAPVAPVTAYQPVSYTPLTTTAPIYQAPVYSAAAVAAAMAQTPPVRAIPVQAAPVQAVPVQAAPVQPSPAQAVAPARRRRAQGSAQNASTAPGEMVYDHEITALWSPGDPPYTTSQLRGASPAQGAQEPIPEPAAAPGRRSARRAEQSQAAQTPASRPQKAKNTRSIPLTIINTIFLIIAIVIVLLILYSTGVIPKINLP